MIIAQKIPEDGAYSFSLKSNANVFIRLHEAELLDADFKYVHGTEITHSVILKKGFHAITIYYLQKDLLHTGMELKWKKPGKSWQDLGNGNFFYLSK